jgi:hypothetical protein
VGAVLAGTAKEAFVTGMDTTVAIGAGVVVLGSVLSFLLLPARTAGSTQVEEAGEKEEDSAEMAGV